MESGERRMMEGQAAKGLISKGPMNDGKERWCESMQEAGFVAVAEMVGEDVVDGGRALLRKHDGNWEMRVEEGIEKKDGSSSGGRRGGNVLCYNGVHVCTFTC
ncbi:hypothetical protein MLD38_007155 [Melastoma candidum]|uniref:Uncharacterized protein n=1 Tax=Melastoma candidum TaxID=119954 RepID=A0ACB9RYQ8_9MYRT|nr:hypothetical protein MLD38_007155 [Melastoma candidum]